MPLTFLAGSYSSSKWPSDLPMSPPSQRLKRGPSIGSCNSLQVELPVPAIQRTASEPRKSGPFRAVAERFSGLRSYVSRTLAPPYVPTPWIEYEVNDAVSPMTDKERHRFSDIDEVDEVVVDREWSDEFETESMSDVVESASSRREPSIPDADSVDLRLEGIWTFPPLAFLRTRLWPRFRNFYRPRFEDPAEEMLFQKETWSQSKRPSLWGSVFFVASCIVGLATIQKPIVLADKIFYYGISPFLSLPMLFMCAYNWPYDRPFFFQTWLCVLTWSWPIYDTIYAVLCGYYAKVTHHHPRLFTCGEKDFMATFYYTSALQAVALFGTSLKRLPATIGALAFLILTCAAIVPLRSDYIHNVFNFLIFEFVLLYMHSQKEMSSRKLFWLRMQLKVQYQRTRKAQVAERQAADSKRRLTSYVFHEVRVPLNTALLAVQNMAARPIAKDHEVEFSALEGSLSMMSKVLNDVLDFNRMDSGRLESLSRPYAFHKVLRSLFIPLRLAADARNLEFVTDLDMRIDEVARRAAYQFMDASPEAISQHLVDQPSGEGVMGMVVGDETRLRQIITNLASNACKFTPAGGKLTIVTRLVLPGPPTPPQSPMIKAPPSSSPRPPSSQLTTTALSLHNESMSAERKESATERIVVRIEVRDTGSGIPPKDMVECKLFSAFNQTEQGRQQGGKGTGLGLALVRQIVKLSGGRLGLRSKVGEGSTFWVELPLGVGRKALIPGTPGTPPPELATTTRFTLPLSPRPVHGPHPGSPGSGGTVAEMVDAATMAASQELTPRTRSSTALHGLMDQGVRPFELMLAKYDSHSPVPTRTLGDTLPGPEYYLPYFGLQSQPDLETDVEFKVPPALGQSDQGPSTPQFETPPLDSNPVADVVPLPPPPVQRQQSLGSVARAARPTYVPLPSPRTFTLDVTPTPSPPLAATGMRVLVVDDDALTRMLMTRMLERMGCRVTTAENGEVALHRIIGTPSPAPSVASTDPLSCEGGTLRLEPRFGVIFLDNQMPKLSGVKLVERLRVMGRTDFVVGVTGNALLTDQKEYLDAGADHVLTKPVLEASLRSMLLLADARKKTLQSQAETVL
ncbi:hypothetical protein R3P38DRAFT_2952994 [Favolaschia claudopus]|uniref:histidine kinase n=1 Tax=Favolaschia claudopus TaxID=2862362 RepID=A0AAW0BH96_9AGAR